MRNRLLAIENLIVVGLTAIVLSPCEAQTAKNADRDNRIISVQFDGLSARDALVLLFSKVGASYSIDPSIQGTVTAKFVEAPFGWTVRKIAAGLGASVEARGSAYLVRKATHATLATFVCATSTSITAEGADVRDVLRLLFKQASVSYAIHPKVQGKVTVHSGPAPFGLLLQRVLDQVNASFRVEGGQVYVIESNDHRSSPADAVVTIELNDVEIRSALSRLFEHVEGSYTVDSLVHGKVTARLESMPFEMALERVASLAGGARVERDKDGVFNVLPPKPTDLAGFLKQRLGSRDGA